MKTLMLFFVTLCSAVSLSAFASQSKPVTFYASGHWELSHYQGVGAAECTISLDYKLDLEAERAANLPEFDSVMETLHPLIALMESRGYRVVDAESHPEFRLEVLASHIAMTVESTAQPTGVGAFLWDLIEPGWQIFAKFTGTDAQDGSKVLNSVSRAEVRHFNRDGGRISVLRRLIPYCYLSK